MSTENKKLRLEKQAMYDEVQENVSGALYMLLADYKGLSMPETDEFKKELRDAQASIQVVKNRMLTRITGEAGFDLGTLTGPTAVIVGDGDVVEVAKILKKLQSDQNRDVIKGGVVEGAVVTAADVVELAKLPGKKELQGILVATIAAPMSGLVGVMTQKTCSLLYVLNAVKEKKEQAA